MSFVFLLYNWSSGIGTAHFFLLILHIFVSNQFCSLQSEFLVAFECGERSAFFELWDKHVSTELRGGDPMCQNLEFSTSVYFAVYPSRMGVRVGVREGGRE